MVSLVACPFNSTKKPSRRVRGDALVLMIIISLVVGANSAYSSSDVLRSTPFTSLKRNGFYSPLDGKENLNGKTLKNVKPKPDHLLPAEYIADTKLPTEIGHFKMRAYRVSDADFKKAEEAAGGIVGNIKEPVVLYYSEKPPFGTGRRLAKDVPVRIHDQCLTSEVFGSQRCDCREQLELSLEYIKNNGGAVIYLQQEGRGIGISNKLAAYELQDMGMDTVDANLHLGLPEDCRHYGVVPSILKEMNIGSIKLMTNNPRKIERLRSVGTKVTGTIPVLVPKLNEYNRKYVQTKAERMSHNNFGSLLENTNAITPQTQRVGADITTSEVKVSMLKGDSALTPGAISEHSRLSLVPDNTLDESKEGVVAAKDGYCFGRQSVEDAIDAVSRGEMIVVVDDMNRENEGDLIMAADLCTPMDMARIVRYSSGVICVGMEGERMDALKLPAMVTNNEDPKGTAFSVTVDAVKGHGITTGISAADRAKTVQVLADPGSTAIDFNRPGHLFPLRAREGGVLARDGHTEAAVDFSHLAGRSPCGVLCEIVSEDNPTEMMRLPELKRFSKRHGFKMTSIADLAQYRRDTELGRTGR